MGTETQNPASSIELCDRFVPFLSKNGRRRAPQGEGHPGGARAQPTEQGREGSERHGRGRVAATTPRYERDDGRRPFSFCSSSPGSSTRRAVRRSGAGVATTCRAGASSRTRPSSATTSCICRGTARPACPPSWSAASSASRRWSRRTASTG